jgi:Ca2+-binding EF-hand superfamily protein
VVLGSDHETIKLKDFGMIMHTLGQSIDHETVEAFTARFKRENGGADGMTLPQFITEIFHQLYYMDTDAYLEKIFRIFDRDHSGEITHGELRDELDKIPASHAYARLSEPDIDLLMREADVDHDGTIGIREWVRLMTGEYDEDEEEEASVSSA